MRIGHFKNSILGKQRTQANPSSDGPPVATSLKAFIQFVANMADVLYIIFGFAAEAVAGYTQRYKRTVLVLRSLHSMIHAQRIPLYRLLQLWASLEEGSGAADSLSCLLLNSGQKLLARWDVVDNTNNLTSSPNLVKLLAKESYRLQEPLTPKSGSPLMKTCLPLWPETHGATSENSPVVLVDSIS